MQLPSETQRGWPRSITTAGTGGCGYRCRERDFLKKISECMERDGKVSKQHTSHPCPVDSLTASGPDPSVCSGKSSGAVYLTRDILASSPHSPHSHSYTLHTRERMNLLHPIYFSAGLTEKVECLTSGGRGICCLHLLPG